ncbi:MAG: DUF4037 domain-containing protein [Anaerolineae bacterium]
MPEFIPGLELAGLYYREAVRPILQAGYPGLVHSAGLIGTGSEVLGFDTEMSADHNWGPQVVLYLSEEDHAHLAGHLHRTLGHELPFSFRGYSTHFEEAPDEPGTALLKAARSRPINHRVHVTTLHRFIRRYLGIDLDRELSVVDWLTIPEQKLRTLVTGAVYHDGLNVLEPMRHKLAYYPHDLWLYMLSAQWQRVGQEEPFVGRAGIVGDEVGSVVIAARLVRDLMRLCLLMERQYAPYAKWFGSAFTQLPCAGRLTPVFRQVLAATRWQERGKHLNTACETLAAMHNDLGLTGPVPNQVSPFHSRPFRVIQAEAIALRLWDAIQDEQVRALPFGVGGIDQYVDSTDVLSHTGRCRKLSVLYTRPGTPPP